MPYYHKKDGGEIGLWSRKCHVCGHKWPWTAWIYYPPPKDMKFLVLNPKTLPAKGSTSYSKWADKFPGASIVASRLPNWPRWARILTLFVVVAIISGFIAWLINK